MFPHALARGLRMTQRSSQHFTTTKTKHLNTHTGMGAAHMLVTVGRGCLAGSTSGTTATLHYEIGQSMNTSWEKPTGWETRFWMASFLTTAGQTTQGPLPRGGRRKASVLQTLTAGRQKKCATAHKTWAWVRTMCTKSMMLGVKRSPGSAMQL